MQHISDKSLKELKDKVPSLPRREASSANTKWGDDRLGREQGQWVNMPLEPDCSV